MTREEEMAEERKKALPPYITREERTIAALERIADALEKMDFRASHMGNVGFR